MRIIIIIEFSRSITDVTSA